MSSQQPTNPVLATQLALERLREFVAGGLAFLLIIAFLVMALIAILNLPNADVFQRTKDLLLMINPFVGVVIGYYFNKVSSDARANALQRAADTASETAIVATADRDRAVQQTETAQTQTQQMRGALSEMVTAAEGVTASQTGKLGALAAGEQPITDADIQFRVALERAKRALNNI